MVWGRFDTRRCKVLGQAVVAALSRYTPKIQAEMRLIKVPVPSHKILLRDLELEVRTFNCLRDVHIDERPGGIASLTIGEALAIPAFGICQRAPKIGHLGAPSK
jgi:hypothetical protein